MNDIRNLLFFVAMGTLAIIFLQVFLIGSLAATLGVIFRIGALIGHVASYFRTDKHLAPQVTHSVVQDK